MPEAKNYYAVLGVARTADAQAIRRAYRRVALACHPDRAGQDAAAAERFRAATEAYGVLADPEHRARYDRGDTASLFGANAARTVARRTIAKHLHDQLRYRRPPEGTP